MPTEKKKKTLSAVDATESVAAKPAPRKKASTKEASTKKTPAKKAASTKAPVKALTEAKSKAKAPAQVKTDDKRKKASSKKAPVEGAPKGPKVNPDDVRIKKFVVDVARMLSDLHFENVLILDVRTITPITDYVMIATGTSQRQIRSVGHEVEEIAKTHGISRYGKDEDEPANWIVLDFVDAMVHLFEAQARAHYDLEMLWGDAVKVEWKR